MEPLSRFINVKLYLYYIVNVFIESHKEEIKFGTNRVFQILDTKSKYQNIHSESLWIIISSLGFLRLF